MLEREPAGEISSACKMVAVVVLYKARPGEAAAFRSLEEALSRLRQEPGCIQTLLFDNTPSIREVGPLPEGIRYEWAGGNAGIAAAYNRALEIADGHGASWLLLLDQDTTLPAGFLGSLQTELRRYESNSRVVALVPVIQSAGTVVSPKKVGFFGLRGLQTSDFGIQEAEITSINSGTTIRCSFLRSIGGFNGEYWLDYLDHWLFRKIYEAGKRAAIWDCMLEHSLSVQNYRRNIRIERYRSILAGEARFMTTHRSRIQIYFYLCRLLMRSLRMALQRQSDLATLTLATIAKIMAHPRSLMESGSQ